MLWIDSLLYVSYINIGVILFLFLLLVLWLIKLLRIVRNNLEVAKKRKANLKYIKKIRDCYKQDISSFLLSYRKDISSKLENEKADKGLFVFWSEAEKFYKKFESDIPQLNRIPCKEESVAIGSFYNEARSLIDGIIYNNHLLKKYQYLRCKIKTKTATHTDLSEVDNVTQEISILGKKLCQQHNELLLSLRTIKSYI